MTQPSRIIVALDYHDKQSAMDFVNRVNPSLCALKIGKSVFTRLGPDFVRELIAKQFRVFLDLKFHDIPNTVFDACTAAAELGIWMLNVHIAGGEKMMIENSCKNCGYEIVREGDIATMYAGKKFCVCEEEIR